MGDASVEVEKDLIEKYNLQNIDVLTTQYLLARIIDMDIQIKKY